MMTDTVETPFSTGEFEDLRNTDDATHGLVFEDPQTVIDNPPIGTFPDDDDFHDSVMKADVRSDDIHDVEGEMDIFYARNGHRFSSRIECDFVAMLPLESAQKALIIERAAELLRLERAANK